ncbi:unnamed protein product [Amoebophrya sp. A25]|nr:unnamed protein product [Amoebophrya sp. A25]|eukprot:GSA25T00008710001.1
MSRLDGGVWILMCLPEQEADARLRKLSKLGIEVEQQLQKMQL